jgi:hypothetical protein
VSDGVGVDMADVDEAGLHLRLSRLLLGCLVAAIASTIGVALFGALTMRPRPEGGLGRIGANAAPPAAMPGLVVCVGLFVVAWVAVIATIARDQILRRVVLLEARLVAFAHEYGEQRDTSGYLRALRTAGLPTHGASEVRQLHRVPSPAEPAE